jgi:hypothetical protein
MTIVLSFLALSGCIDLDSLRSAESIGPIDTTDTGAPVLQSDAGAPLAPDAGALVLRAPDAGREPACGVVGRACCGGNACESGACLRGICAAFGGVHGRTDVCMPECRVRNGYTAGCSCPFGFRELRVPTMMQLCDGASMGTGALALCRPERDAVGDLAGVYVTASPLGSCAGGCAIPDEISGACECPVGTTAIELDTAFAGTCGTQSAKLVLCAAISAPVTTFGGAFQRGIDAACRVPNPRTGDCSCPAGATEQFVPGEPAPGLSFCLE